MLERFQASSARVFVGDVARRWGKSKLACGIAVATAAMPGTQIRYATPTAKMAETIVEPHMRDLLNGAPQSMRARFYRQRGMWEFPNGSQIWIAGCDGGNAERLRGSGTHLGIVDEAGFIDDLEYLVSDILMPQTLTTNGRILMISTPARTPDHAFRSYCERAERDGAYFHDTIYGARHIPAHLIDEYMAESGGASSTTWRREYLAEHVVDETIAVVPEFAAAESAIVRDVPPARYRDRYVSIDVGYTDLTVALFAWYDFDSATVVIEDERVFVRQTSGPIAAECAAAEKALWGDAEPYMRVCDAPEIVLADMSQMHKYNVRLPVKDDREAAVNGLRTAIGNHRVAISPRCKTLIAHLRHAVWNRQRTSFERSAGAGHFDAVDAMIYLVRTVERNRNPAPHLDPAINDTTHFIPPEIRQDPRATRFARALYPNLKRTG